jgi:hypothetical protein
VNGSGLLFGSQTVASDELIGHGVNVTGIVRPVELHPTRFRRRLGTMWRVVIRRMMMMLVVVVDVTVIAEVIVVVISMQRASAKRRVRMYVPARSARVAVDVEAGARQRQDERGSDEDTDRRA